MNNPPFKIGQKMVRTGPSRRFVIKGNVYTSAGCFQCKCGQWKVLIKELPNVQGIKHCTCGKCRTDSGYKEYFVELASCFAPIDEQKERIRYVAVSESLREIAVEIAAIETNYRQI